LPSVLITGANRGLGLGLVKVYLEDGWFVYACSRNLQKADSLNDLKESYPEHLLLFSLDVEDDSQVTKLAINIDGQPIDVLLNVAGYYGRNIVTEPGGFQEFGSSDYDDWQRIFNVNIVGPMKVSEALIENVKAGSHKKIITLSSILGSIGGNNEGNMYPYRASKAAVNAIMRSMAVDLAKYEIISIPLHPGWVRTDMGGPSADLDVSTSVKGMKHVIDSLTIEDSGSYLVYDGSKLPW